MEILIHYKLVHEICKFKIDLIVWKYGINTISKKNVNTFKIDLIVWKCASTLIGEVGDDCLK